MSERSNELQRELVERVRTLNIDAFRRGHESAVEAVAMIEEAIALAYGVERSEWGDHLLAIHAQSLIFLAKLQIDLGDLDAAERNTDASQAITEQVPNPVRSFLIAIYKAEILMLRGRFEEAITWAERANEPSRENRASTSLMPLAYLGRCHRSLGNYARALGYFLQARALAVDAGDRGNVAGIDCDLGLLYRAVHEWSTAAECYGSAITIYEELDDRRSSIEALEGRGACLEEAGDIEGALASYGEALDVARELQLRPMQAELLEREASAFDLSGRADEAVERRREALDLIGGIGAPSLEIGPLLGLAEAWLRQGRFDEAATDAARALEIAESTAAKPRIASALLLLARIDRARGEHASACASFDRHIGLKSELDSHEVHEQVARSKALREIESARQQAEIERLRNVELAEAMRQLEDAHAELKRAQAQLVHAGKMASIGTLTAGIAHEINNPANFIRNSVGPLRRDIDQILGGAIDEAERREIVEEVAMLLRGIEDGAARTAEIVRSLRTFSRLDEDECKPVDLLEGIESTLTLLAPRLSSIVLVRRMNEVPAVECYPGQINQVFMSLLSNAIDACDDGGSITVSSTADDGRVEIAIADTGTGMAEDVLPRIFEPFFTTKPVGGGQGLGLAIANSIVENHGGALVVESTPGAGSTFRVSLPTRRTSKGQLTEDAPR